MLILRVNPVHNIIKVKDRKARESSETIVIYQKITSKEKSLNKIDIRV